MSEQSAKPVGVAEQGVKLRGAEKLARIPVKVIPTAKEDMPRKPDWNDLYRDTCEFFGST